MFPCPLPYESLHFLGVCLSFCVCLSLISPFSLFSILSLLSFFSSTFSLSVLSLLSFSLPSPLTSLPSYPFSLSIHSPPSSLPLLSSTLSFLPSLTFFSLLSPPHSFLSFQLSLSPILSVLSHLSLLYIFSYLSLLSLLFSPFSTSLPFSSLFSPLILSLSTPFCLSLLHFLSSLLSLVLSLLCFLPSLTSPFLFSIPSPLHSLSTQTFYLHSLMCLIFILFPLPFFPL